MELHPNSMVMVRLPLLIFILVVSSSAIAIPMFLLLSYFYLRVLPLSVAILFLCIAAYMKVNKTYRSSILVFLISFFFSGLFWTPRPTYPFIIDYILAAHGLPPTRLFMALQYGVNLLDPSYAAELVVLVLFTLTSVVTSEIVAVHSAKHLKISEALFFLLLILILWCLLPIIMLANHSTFWQIVPLPLGPLIALGILLSRRTRETDVPHPDSTPSL